MATIAGTNGADRQTGGAGDDTIRGSAGDDTIEGGAGSDTYVLHLGRAGLVVTSPAEGVLVLRPAPSGPRLGSGTDTVSGVESFQLVGPDGTLTVAAEEMMARFNFGYAQAPTAADDKLVGAAGADSIDGLGGDDTVEGGHGDDRLDGGAGADRLTGGEGADVFVFRSAGGSGVGAGKRDVVTDFVAGADKIDLGAIDADDKVAGDQAFAYGGPAPAPVATANAVTWSVEGGDTVVQADVDGDGRADLQVRLAGYAAGLSASDFVL